MFRQKLRGKLRMKFAMHLYSWLRSLGGIIIAAILAIVGIEHPKITIDAES